MTTECELLFGEDSYGLIKNVNKGIRINKINSNLTMNILGNTLVDSSLMFYSVSGSSTVNNITGYYGGYINNFTCT